LLLRYEPPISAEGAVQADLARTYSVATISRLAAPSLSHAAIDL